MSGPRNIKVGVASCKFQSQPTSLTTEPTEAREQTLGDGHETTPQMHPCSVRVICGPLLHVPAPARRGTEQTRAELVPEWTGVWG